MNYLVTLFFFLVLKKKDSLTTSIPKFFKNNCYIKLAFKGHAHS